MRTSSPMIDENCIRAHPGASLDPGSAGLARYSQIRMPFSRHAKACHPFYAACPDRVQGVMDQFGRPYRPSVSLVRLRRTS